MKTPLNWISLYTPLETLLSQKSPTELAHIYSTHTAEIDGIEYHDIDLIVIGKVLSCERHPESKKLSICEVQIVKNTPLPPFEGGQEQSVRTTLEGEQESLTPITPEGELEQTTIILTGAPNIATGQYVPVALVGCQLAPDFVIGERRMAGMMSRGMICGADEIGLSTESDGGIMVLEDTWDRDLLESMIGQSLWDLRLPFPGKNNTPFSYRLGGITFEIDNKFITNRPDLFGVYGNAREWGAVFGLDFEEYTSTGISGFMPSQEGQQLLNIKIETPRCLAYNAIRMDHIDVKQSPFSLRLMMERAGLSPKMDLVDITNLILTEFGQPMHVFDADKVHGTITVRLARAGESLLALNGETYNLTTEDMIIADDMGPIALAGIIGGMDSAVSETTTSVIWESATFAATSVRLSAQRHGIRTDASTRYEKSLDPLLSSFATSRIMDYLNFLRKNIEITASASHLDESQVKHIEIEVSHEFINTKAGVHIPTDRIETILTSLGFTYSISGDVFSVKVPSWRSSKDISIREDITEEVIRIYGYDQIPLHPLDADFGISEKNHSKLLKNTSLDYWKNKNWHEVYNYSFTNARLDRGIMMDDMTDAVGIQNAFNVEYTHMRRSLAVRLFENIANNSKNKDLLRFFEIGKVYAKNLGYTDTIDGFLREISDKPYGEIPMIAGVTTSGDIMSLRSEIEAYLSSIIGYVPPLHQESHVLPYLHPGVSGMYRVGEVVLARFGRVHPETASAYGIPPETLYWEIDLTTLLSYMLDRESLIQPISRYQSIDRELNFIMDESVHTGPVALSIDALHPWIHQVHVDSIYRDEAKLGAHKKSVNYAFMLQSQDHTISDEQALEVQNMVIQAMGEKGYKLRGE